MLALVVILGYTTSKFLCLDWLPAADDNPLSQLPINLTVHTSLVDLPGFWWDKRQKALPMWRQTTFTALVSSTYTVGSPEKAIRLVRHDFSFHKLILTTPKSPYCLYMFGNGLQDYLLHHRDQGEAYWLFLPFWTIGLTFASSGPQEPSLTTTFQKITKSGLAVTPACSLSTHGYIPQGPMDSCMSSFIVP